MSASFILEFIGSTMGAQIFRHPETKRSIRAGRSLAVRYVNVERDEIDYFLSLGVFRIAHESPRPVSVQRKDTPVRIEPVAETAQEKDETPEENVVSFDNAQVESLVDWLSESVAEESVEEEPVKEEVVTAQPSAEVVEEKTDKIRRGRPRS